MSRRALLRIGWSDRARADIDYEGVTSRVRVEWEQPGAHESLLRALEPAAAVVAEVGQANAGLRVLDVGAGDGNVTLACVGRGAAVDACDLAAAMVARGRERCAAADADVTWRIADVQALPYANGSYDLVVSAFGAMLAPDALRTARELVRVCRPGGQVVLAAWVPRGLPGRLFEFVESRDPLPNGVPSPARWGNQAVAIKRLSPLLEDISVRTRTLALRYPSPDELFAALAPGTLDERRRRALRPDFDGLLASTNNRPPAAEIDARYLVIRGRRPSGSPGGRTAPDG